MVGTLNTMKGANMPRLNREQQLHKDIKETLYRHSKFIKSHMPTLSVKLTDIIENPETKPETLLAIYKTFIAELHLNEKTQMEMEKYEESKKVNKEKAREQVKKIKLENENLKHKLSQLNKKGAKDMGSLGDTSEGAGLEEDHSLEEFYTFNAETEH